MTALVLAVLSGLLILDVVLDHFCSYTARQARRDRDRARVAMRRTIDRTGGPRP